MAQADTFRRDNTPSQGCHLTLRVTHLLGNKAGVWGRHPVGRGSRMAGVNGGHVSWREHGGWLEVLPRNHASALCFNLPSPSSPDHCGGHRSATQVPNPAGTPGEHSCWTGRTSSRKTGHAVRSSSIPAAPQQGGGSLLLCRALLFSISPNQGMTWQTGSIPSEHWVQHVPASAAAPSTQGPSGGERDGWDCRAPPPLKMPPTSSQHSKQPYLHLTQPGPAGWKER